MSLEVTIKEICGNLCSNKITERKRSVETLKDYLTRNAVPDLLSDNTRKKAGFGWNDLFDNITDYLLKEAEKYESSKTFHTVTYPLCVSILHLCVTGSIKGRAYIKCDKIIEAALFVLRNKYLTNAIGDAYLSLLQKHVLSCENYVTLITPGTWEELLDVSIAGCLDKISKLDDFPKLKLLWLVIKNATECCQFSCSLRNNLTDITEYFHNINKINRNKKTLEVVSDIVVLILDVLYLENRLSVCEFIEKNLPLIFEFYEQNLDVKQKSHVFSLLHTSIAIHHPLGRIENEESALAHDWQVWNTRLQSIMELVTSEINYMQKNHRNSNVSLYTCTFFNQVSAIMFFLTFKMSAHVDLSCDGERAAKRPRTNFNIKQKFKDLIGEIKQNRVPWLGITEMYVKHFGCSLSAHDHEILIKALEEFVKTSNVKEIWCIFESLTCQVLKNLNEGAFTGFTEHIISLWTTCVRNSTNNSSHIAIHGVLQTILSLNILDYKNIKPLLLLYYEKGMPVSNSSVQTLNMLFKKFYSKCCSNNGRTKCFKWFINGQVTQLDVDTVRELFLTLLLNDNVNNNVKRSGCIENETLYHILFKTVDKSILYADFELQITEPEPNNKAIQQALEINEEMNYQVVEYLQERLLECNEKMEKGNFDLVDCFKILKVTLTYLDIALNYNYHKVISEQIYDNFKSILKTVYIMAIKRLKSGVQISEKNALLKALQVILEEYDTVLNNDVRTCIDNDFFHCITDILNSDVPADDDESDLEMCHNALKNNCIFFLAAYCKKNLNYRDELLELILNPELYNFSSQLDVEFALKCIRFLNQSDIEDSPIESTFVLMQSMCKDLFRKSTATASILQTLLIIIDRVWQHGDNLRRNCLIMVKSYLHRCENMFYPPEVAALVYQCVTKIIILNNKDVNPIELTFKDVIIDKIKGNIHSLRLYCGYLINEMKEAFAEEDVFSCLLNIKDLFTVALSNEKDTILKDELSNRTASLLHTYYLLAIHKPSKIHQIVQEIIFLQQEKSLDKPIVKKVLNIIINKVTQKSLDNYLDQNILCLLEYWLEKKLPLDNLPMSLFNFESDLFYKKYMNWLVSADILWHHQGNVQKSDMMKKFKQMQSEELILEESFCNIIILSLPYIVNEKYSLGVKKFNCKELASAASRMFQQMRQKLQSETWSKLFVENMDRLVLLTALHLKDNTDAKQTFDVEVSISVESFSYPKEIFCGILKYFGELIDDNIMECFCKDQPLAMLNILFTLWDLVLSEKIFSFKVMLLHTFIIYIENIPLGFPSDAIIFNFASVNTARAIKEVKSKKELDVFSKALLRILTRVSSNKNEVLQKETVAQLLSILTIKKDESEVSNEVYNYVVMNLKEIDDDMQALISVLTEFGTEACFTEMNFLDKLQKYERNLSYASTATLSSMKKFLSAHETYLSVIMNKLDNKGFSEDCEDSVIHKIIVALCNILRTSTDEKMIVEASNCLAEVGTYDLKTLVTVPPKDTAQLVNVKPTQYFAITLVKALLEIIFNENPTVSKQVCKALLHLMKFKDGQIIKIEWGIVESQILKCLTPSTCESFAQFKVRSVSTEWVPASNEHHVQWITRITVDLLQMLESPSNYLSSLPRLCMLKPSICSKILPSLVGLLLEHSSENLMQVIGQQINSVFNYIWSRSFNETTSASENSTVSKISNILDHDQKMIVDYLLDVVNAIRLQTNHLQIRCKWRVAGALRHMKLEYEKVSRAAALAERHLAALYYAELWAAAHNDDVPPASPRAAARLPAGEHVHRILRNCFVSIGELDAIDGCGTAHLTSEEERRKHLLHTGQHADALLLHDIVLSHGEQADSSLQHGLVMSLHKSGMHHLALQYIKSFPENDELNDVKFDCLAYLGDWSEIVDTIELEEKTKQPLWNPDVVIKSLRYACLKESLNADPNQNYQARLEVSLNRAKLATSKLCLILNMDNCQSVYKVVANLHLLRDIQDYCSLRRGHTDLAELLNRWQVDKLPSFKNFKHLETLLSQRSLILENAAKHYESFSKDIVDLQLQYVEMGLTNQRVQMAQRLVESVKKMSVTKKVRLVESQVAWSKGHKDIALATLHGALADQSHHHNLDAMCLRQYGLWMAECKRENARDIIDNYLKHSLQVLSEEYNVEARFKVYHDIAKFADSEYKQIVSYMNSAVFEKKVKCIDNLKGTAASLKQAHTRLTIDEKKTLLTTNRFMEFEEAEVSNTRAEKNSFLNLALRYYMLSLKQCEDNNLSIFRVISLWFDNPEFEFSDSGDSFRDLLNAIPSWKFIAVLPQMAPRLTTDQSSFVKYLQEVLARCAVEHPHHTLPILFYLKNSDKDNVALAGAGAGAASAARASGAGARVLAAGALVRKLAKRNDLAAIISQMELLCDAFISFAYLKVQSAGKQAPRQRLPAAEPLAQLRAAGALAALPVPALPLHIQHNGDYSAVPNITKFDDHFELVGGINYPKKISCRSSDGKCRILLIKGEDDLRQDAVMQQVFNIVNTLLENNPVTKKNKLLIRTYKVVPLSRRSGVLGWCEDTTPLGTYLEEAHILYRPKDMKPGDARRKLEACRVHRKTNREKLRVFREILANFKPVFHNFFTEYYHDPVTWYERRLAYTRSVATSSMVGYILGIGDRHVKNILIDKTTGEVIHIDFGIAFDQGMALPTPETVPFRLTQDIISGFGCCGIEGMFRRCCEKTLQLLRDNQETLLTILQVLLCDPLYSWTVKGAPKEAAQCRGGGEAAEAAEEAEAEGAGSALAERALLSVSGKLSGAEGGVAVAGQVARLLHVAADPANLCTLFPGWQPYL